MNQWSFIEWNICAWYFHLTEYLGPFSLFLYECPRFNLEGMHRLSRHFVTIPMQLLQHGYLIGQVVLRLAIRKLCGICAIGDVGRVSGPVKPSLIWCQYSEIIRNDSHENQKSCLFTLHPRFTMGQYSKDPINPYFFSSKDQIYWKPVPWNRDIRVPWTQRIYQNGKSIMQSVHPNKGDALYRLGTGEGIQWLGYSDAILTIYFPGEVYLMESNHTLYALSQ